MKIHTKYFGDLNRQTTDWETPDTISCPTCRDYDLNTNITKPITVIPFNTQKAPNGKDNWVYFDLATEEWIYEWLNRIVLEYTHKVKTFPVALSKLEQTINKKGTYDRLNSFNSILTICSGLVLNRARATDIKFTTKQLEDIEKCFEVATYVLRDTSVLNKTTGKTDRKVLADKDIGYHRKTLEPNRDIGRIYFAKNSKLTIAADGQTYDNTPHELLFN